MLETLLSVFAFGEIGFFIVIGMLCIIYTAAVEKNEHGLAIFGTIVGAFLLWKPLMAAISNWQLILMILAIYTAIGGAWSIFRWFKYCRKYINEIDPWGETPKFVKEKSTPEKYYISKLSPSEHKSQIMSWIIYWPFSAFWNIAGDLISGIFDMLTNVYKHIATSVVKKAASNLKSI